MRSVLRVNAPAALRRAGVLCALSCLLCCTFEPRPSLGANNQQLWPGPGDPPPSAPSAPEPKPEPPPAAPATAGAGSPAATDDDAGMSPSSDAGAMLPPAANPDPPTASPAPACPTGMYAVELACSSTVLQTEGRFPAAFTFVPAANETVATSTGRLEFYFSGAVFAADVAGEIDCATGEFRGDIQNGTFAFVAAPVPTMFDGWLEGRLDPGTGRLQGEWYFGVQLGGCAGEWTARAQP